MINNIKLIDNNNFIKLMFNNIYRPPNSDELNIDCLPVGDSPRKPHNLKVLQSNMSKLKKQIKMLTVSINNPILSYICKMSAVGLPIRICIYYFNFIIFKGSSH